VGPVPADVRVVRSNDQLWELVNRCRRDGIAIPAVALLGGDLMRSVGGSGDEGRLEGDVALLPIDLVRVEASDRCAWFAAHLVARGSWWFGPIMAIMNAEHRGLWDVAPRAHPNDGRVDVVTVSAAFNRRDRWRARGRLPHGLHVPHPSIEIRQRASHDISFDRPTAIRLDDRAWATVRSLRIDVEPDAFIACV
jgi:hypothetical protein